MIIEEHSPGALREPVQGRYAQMLEPARGDVLRAAADAVDGLREAYIEAVEADRELARLRAASIPDRRSVSVDDTAAVKDATAYAYSLRAAADERGAASEAYNEAWMQKCDEVSTMYPQIAGIVQALGQYASGKVKITDPVTFQEGVSCRTYMPEITDANRARVEAFTPAVYPAVSRMSLEFPWHISELAEAYERQRQAVDRLLGAWHALDAIGEPLTQAVMDEGYAYSQVLEARARDNAAGDAGKTDAKPDAGKTDAKAAAK